jgi:hypothetical protein
MKNLLIVAVLIGLGAVVYAKVIRSSPEKRACSQLQTLCGDDVDVGECTKDFDEATKLVGHEATDKAASCMASASSCIEAAGCVVGAGAHAFDAFARGMERGAR